MGRAPLSRAQPQEGRFRGMDRPSLETQSCHFPTVSSSETLGRLGVGSDNGASGAPGLCQHLVGAQKMSYEPVHEQRGI